MAKRGKNYRASKELLGEKQLFTVDEAIPLLVKTSKTKFDESCEVHMKLGIDPKQADQLVRGTLSMPHGTGKTVKVIAIVPDERTKEAKAAGAMEAGSADLIDKINGGWLDFDVVVATPSMMKEIGKVAKTLGQKGLMPNPKSGTVTEDLKSVIGEIIKGKIEYRNDKQGNLHNIFGKVSFGEDKLKENLKSYIKTIVEAKPTGAKGVYIQSITVTTTMGPGIHLEIQGSIK